MKLPRRLKKRLNSMESGFSSHVKNIIFESKTQVFKLFSEYAEKWQEVKDFPGYEISNTGRVKSLKRNNPIILKYDINSNGYLRVHLSNKSTKKVFVHKLVGEHFIENPDNRMYLDHKDRVRINNNESNLRWCTIQENMKNRKFKPRATR